MQNKTINLSSPEQVKESFPVATLKWANYQTRYPSPAWGYSHGSSQLCPFCLCWSQKKTWLLAWMGAGFEENGYKYMYGWVLHCPPATTTTLLISCARLFETLRTAARQVLLSMGILQARILEWVAMPSSRGIFLTQGSNPSLPPCR